MAEDGREELFSELEAKHRKRVLLWGGLGVTLLAAAVAAALLAFRPEQPAPPDNLPDGSESTASPSPTSTPEPGDSSSATVTPPADAPDDGGTDSGSSDGGGAAPVVPLADADRIAYRLEGSLLVAEGDCTNPRKIASASGAIAFALSPDGRTLAVAQAGALQFIDVAKTTVTAQAKVTAKNLSWSPDSEKVAFESASSDSTEIRVVGRNGKGLKTLGPGRSPRFAPDGEHVALMTGSTGSAPLAVVLAEGGSLRTVRGTGRALDFDWASADSLYVLSQKTQTEGAPPTMSIERIGLDGESSSVYRAELGERFVTWRYLYASRDGKSLMFAEVGDDGYSRAHVLGKDGGLVDLTVRRDTYPAGWTREGKVLFVEGNAFQGERTDLMCAKADGAGRRVIAAGASR